MVAHRELHKAFTSSLPANAVAMWELELTAWEKDTTLPNPLETHIKSMYWNCYTDRYYYKF